MIDRSRAVRPIIENLVERLSLLDGVHHEIRNAPERHVADDPQLAEAEPRRGKQLGILVCADGEQGAVGRNLGDRLVLGGRAPKDSPVPWVSVEVVSAMVCISMSPMFSRARPSGASSPGSRG